MSPVPLSRVPTVSNRQAALREALQALPPLGSEWEDPLRSWDGVTMSFGEPTPPRVETCPSGHMRWTREGGQQICNLRVQVNSERCGPPLEGDLHQTRRTQPYPIW